MKFTTGMQINIEVFCKLMLSAFLPSDITKVFYKLIVSPRVCVARHASSTPKKLTISLEYLKENVKDEVDVLPADKHQRLLQIVTIFLVVWDQACLHYPK